MKTKYFITGASGFIGAGILNEVVKLKDTEVHICLRKNSNKWRLKSNIDNIILHYLDLKDFPLLKETLIDVQPHYIFNCAEESSHTSKYSEQVEYYLNSNKLVFNLLEACKFIKPISIVHACSSTIYRHTPELITEKTPFLPISNKGLIKLAERNICSYYAHHFDIPIRLARIFRAYGPMEQYDRLINSILFAVKNKSILKLSSHDVVRDYIFIGDLVEGMLNMAHANLPNGEEVNFASGKSSNSYDIMAIIKDLTQEKVNISEDIYPKLPADRTHCMVDISKAKELLNWEPQTTIEEGLKRTYNWWESNNA